LREETTPRQFGGVSRFQLKAVNNNLKRWQGGYGNVENIFFMDFLIVF
jgi:hypothetical protein